MNVRFPWRASSYNEPGFGEFIGALGAMLVVLLAVFALGAGEGGEPATHYERPPQSVENATAAFYSMTRELHEAQRINVASYVRIDIEVRVEGRGLRRVVYDCGVPAEFAGLGSCVRYETALGRPLPDRGKVVIDRLMNGRDDAGGRVFFAARSKEPAFVRAKVDLPGDHERARGDDRIVLSDGIRFKNF